MMGSRKKLKPVVCGGRQPDSSTFIVGPSLQFCDDGCLIPIDKQEYVWIPCIIKRLKANSIVYPIDTLPADIPNDEPAIMAIVNGLQDMTGENFVS